MLQIHCSTAALVSDTVVGYIKTMFEYCASENMMSYKEKGPCNMELFCVMAEGRESAPEIVQPSKED